MAGVVDALKKPGTLEAKWVVAAEHGRQDDTADLTPNTSLIHQMLQTKAKGLLPSHNHTMEIIVLWAGNSPPHLIPVTLSVLVGHCLTVNSLGSV